MLSGEKDGRDNIHNSQEPSDIEIEMWLKKAIGKHIYN